MAGACSSERMGDSAHCEHNKAADAQVRMEIVDLGVLGPENQ